MIVRTNMVVRHLIELRRLSQYVPDMMRFVGMILMALCLTVTSVAALEVCTECHHTEEQMGQVSQTQQDHNALAGHHCACQHIVADRDPLPGLTYIPVASVVVGIFSTGPAYFSLSHGPLLEPPSRA